MEPKDAFNHTMARVESMLKLFDLLCNQRRKAIRQDWARKFKVLMHWNQGETIYRVDGNGAVIILRESANITDQSFCEDELSELLRAALVMAVSALDRYCHELVTSKIIGELKKPEDHIASELRKMEIPLIKAVEAIRHARKPDSRPMNMVKAILQDKIHRNFTLQKAGDIEQALHMVGINQLWTSCGTTMGEKPEQIKRKLNSIVRRRDSIVHEGDLVKHRKGGSLTLNPIKFQVIHRDIDWIKKLVEAIDAAS